MPDGPALWEAINGEPHRFVPLDAFLLARLAAAPPVAAELAHVA